MGSVRFSNVTLCSFLDQNQLSKPNMSTKLDGTKYLLPYFIKFYYIFYYSLGSLF